MQKEQKVTKSIFASDIDERCPGYSFFGKLAVVLGILGDKKENDALSAIADELDAAEASE